MVRAAVSWRLSLQDYRVLMTLYLSETHQDLKSFRSTIMPNISESDKQTDSLLVQLFHSTIILGGVFL
jgi:hypothetical protein